jgi:hypothetical protein
MMLQGNRQTKDSAALQFDRKEAGVDLLMKGKLLSPR